MLHAAHAAASAGLDIDAALPVDGGRVWGGLLLAVPVHAGADALNELLAASHHPALAVELVPRTVRVLQSHALAEKYKPPLETKHLFIG